LFGEGEHLSLEGGEEVGGRVVDLYGAAEGGAAFFGGAPQEQADGAVGEGSDVIGGFDNHGGEVEQRGGRGLGGEVGEGGPREGGAGLDGLPEAVGLLSLAVEGSDFAGCHLVGEHIAAPDEEFEGGGRGCGGWGGGWGNWGSGWG